MIDAFVRLMNAPEGTCDPVNLGNPHEITMLELAQQVREATQSESEIVFRPLPIDDPWHRQPDISAARALLDWAPSTSLEKGLTATAAHFRERLSDSAMRSEKAGRAVHPSLTTANKDN